MLMLIRKKPVGRASRGIERDRSFGKLVGQMVAHRKKRQ
jgi:hypothetical protein